MEPVKTPKQRQREKEANHEQEHEHMKGHNDPRCLKWGAWRAPVEARLRRVYSTVKRLGEMSELSTTERGSTRYIGLERTHLQHLATAAALNLVRSMAWFNGLPRAQTRHSVFARLYDAA
jgi:hypothetical protein